MIPSTLSATGGPPNGSGTFTPLMLNGSITTNLAGYSCRVRALRAFGFGKVNWVGSGHLLMRSLIFIQTQRATGFYSRIQPKAKPCSLISRKSLGLAAGCFLTPPSLDSTNEFSEPNSPSQGFLRIPHLNCGNAFGVGCIFLFASR